MHRIGDSDVWYSTLKLPKGARFTYRLVPNNPAWLGEPQTTAQPILSTQNDGIVRRPPEFSCRSVVELPDAAPEPWIVSKPGTPTGRIEKQTIKSAIQKLERDLFSYTPAGYKSDGPPRTPLLVLFDGDDILSDDFQGQTTLDNLIAARKIPPTVVLMVDNVETGVWLILLPIRNSPTLWQRNWSHGFGHITTSLTIHRALWSAARVPAGLPQRTWACGTQKCLATCSANPARSGGRQSTAEAFAPRSVQKTADATPILIAGTVARKKTGWRSNSLAARNCQCDSSLRQGPLK